MSTVLWSEAPKSGTYAVTLEWPVGWGDLDSFGHVNNTIYFRHFEHVRIEYFRTIGMLEHMASCNVGPILAHTECRFRRAVAFPDTLTLAARVAVLNDDRFTMHYRLTSNAQKEVAAYGTGEIVMFDYGHQRKTALPEVLRERMIAIERG